VRSLSFNANTEEERIEIFRDYFDRDIESFFSSTVVCCSKCVDQFEALWPGTVNHGLQLQYGYMTIDSFLKNSRVQDDFYPEEIQAFAKHLTCPNCDQVLDGEFWIYEHPFDVAPEFWAALDEIAALARRSPFLLLTHPFARKVFDTIAVLGATTMPQLINGSYFRARRAEGIPTPKLNDFGPPPPRFVEEGRYNHAGHSMLYLAAAEGTALAEVASVGMPYHVAGLLLNVQLKVLDLLLKDDAESDVETLIQCLARSALCAAPRVGEGWLKPEYVFTRYLADCARHARFDAVRYGSTKAPNGSNLVLLAPPDDIAAIASLIAIRTFP
jgi:RES domain-containing protein